MDTESLKNLGTLLLFGLAFFLMMRFGCGAHMMGGRGHGGHGSHTKSGEEKDPVCGMTVDPGQAAGAGLHAGATYYFCSVACRDKFEKEPAKYAHAAAPGENQHAGSCHG